VSEQARFREQSDGFVKLTITDEAGDEIPAGSINAIYWTLFDKETAQVINSRSNVAESSITSPHYVHLVPLDNVIVTATKAVETHVLEYLVGYNSDRGTGLSIRGKVEIPVDNLTKVT